MNIYVTQIVTLKISKTETQNPGADLQSKFGLDLSISEKTPEFPFLVAYSELMDTFGVTVQQILTIFALLRGSWS